jgi:hypothetical protein
MTKIISHRGNLIGVNSEYENNPTYIDQAIAEGFDVEIDVWFIDGEFFLGHDSATYQIESSWILSRSVSLWCHAKNIEALEQLMLIDGVKCFWHETDKTTITSNRILWMYPGNYSRLGVTVEFGEPKNIPHVFGICTDYPKLWINTIKGY